MAGIYKRGGVWYAQFRINGRIIRQSTGVPIKGQQGVSARQARKLARQAADLAEQQAKGECVLSVALDALRTAARAQGVGGVPTVREYLATIRERKHDRSQRNRERAHRLFLDFLGKDADMRLDLLTRQHCRKFIRSLAEGGKIAVTTAGRHKAIISAALRQAVLEDDYLLKNPMEGLNVREIYTATAGAAAAAQTMRREPFSPDEMRRLMNEAPAPWCDMVAVSWYRAGLSLSDVALMQWDAVDLAAGEVHLAAEVKTRQERVIPICLAFRTRLEEMRARHDAGVDSASPYLFPAVAAQYEVNKAASISTRFTSLLRAMGIVQDAIGEAKQGKCHRMYWLSSAA